MLLSSMVMSSLNDARDRARLAKVQTDFKQIERLILEAQLNTNEYLKDITNSGCSYCACSATSGGLDSLSCSGRWEASIDAIVLAAGEDVSVAERFYRDPWGYPYLLDENEGESTCGRLDYLRTTRGNDSYTVPDVYTYYLTATQTQSCG